MHAFHRQPHGASHVLSRLDPRLKLLATLALLAMVLSCKGLAFPLLVAAAALGLCLVMGVRPRLLLVRFAEPLFIAGMVLFLKCLCSGHEPLFSWQIFGVEVVGHRDGLLAGLLIAS